VSWQHVQTENLERNCVILLLVKGAHVVLRCRIVHTRYSVYISEWQHSGARPADSQDTAPHRHLDITAPNRQAMHKNAIFHYAV